MNCKSDDDACRYALPHLKKTHGQIVVMSSYSGEVGLSYRTAYCASKFAVTGFFESLRMEIKNEVDITIICPVTVQTEFRKHALKVETREDSNHSTPKEEPPTKGNSVQTLSEAMDIVVSSIDRRARKVLFPTNAWLSAYVRPFYPDFIDKKLMKMAAL